MNKQMDVKMKVPCVLQDFIPFKATAQKVMRGHNIVAVGWARASNPHLHLNPPLKHTLNDYNGPTDRRTKPFIELCVRN